MKDTSTGEGFPDKPSYIYHVPEKGGEPVELTLCENVFYIYEGKIYYRVVDKTTKTFRETDLDGSNKRIVYQNALDESNSYHYNNMLAAGGKHISEGREAEGIYYYNGHLY